jgi:uncharacterized protein
MRQRRRSEPTVRPRGALARFKGRFGAVAQLAERFHGMEEARGSIPLSSTEVPPGRDLRLSEAAACRPRLGVVSASVMPPERTSAPAPMVELDPAECWALLRSHDVGRLAVSIAREPDIFPINYVVDRQTIVFRTAPGTKLTASILGRAVAFEIDGLDDRVAWSVVVKGRAIQVERIGELFAAERLPLFPWRRIRTPPATRSRRRADAPPATRRTAFRTRTRHRPHRPAGSRRPTPPSP